MTWFDSHFSNDHADNAFSRDMFNYDIERFFTKSFNLHSTEIIPLGQKIALFGVQINQASIEQGDIEVMKAKYPEMKLKVSDLNFRKANDPYIKF